MSYYNRGLSKGELNDDLGAIADYSKAIELDKDDAYSYYNRGICKLNSKQKESACEDFSKAGELGFDKAYEAIKKYCY